MSGGALLVDTGPLVAFFNQQDEHHERCKEYFSRVNPPIHSTWLVITEAAWILRQNPEAIQGLLQLVTLEVIQLHHLDNLSAKYMAMMMMRYHSLGLQIADASLLFLAEHLNTRNVFTLDYRDFSVVRLENGESMRIVPE